MKARFHIPVFAMLLFAVAMILSSLATGSALSSHNTRALKKIAPWALNSARSTGQAEFLVVLSDQADLGRAYALATKRGKGRYVRDALWNKARSTQDPLLEWLRERNIEHRSYYIVNAIWVKAELPVMIEIAARAEVLRIEGNPRIQSVHEPDAQELSVKQERAAGVEQGVSYIRAPEVWAMGYTGQGIVIAGADTGYQWDHPALKSHYRGWNGATADHDYNWHDSIHAEGGDCGPDSPQPCDDSGHGTHTIGTAVGDDGAGNQIGVAPGAKWIGCRNMDRGNGTPATYIECMEFFLAPYPVGGTPADGDPDRAPHITTNSWTCPPSEGCSSDTLQAAVEAQRAAGIMMVVAAGNAGTGCTSLASPPSIYDAVYTVGALDNGTDNIAGFSSRGPVAADGSNRLKPDISAPGTNVRSSYRDDDYRNLNGTSMATPHVAGAIALLWSAQTSLRNRVAETEAALNDTAVHLLSDFCGTSGPPNNIYGYGRMDIKAAVDFVLTSIAPANEEFPATGGQGHVDVTAPGGFSWSAKSDAEWIHIVSGSTGAGNASVTYAAVHNLTGNLRQGTLTIAGKTFTVTQQGAAVGDCTYKIPAKKSFRANGGTGALNVTAGAGCDWRAVSLSDWITVTEGCCGTGNGGATYSVAPNATGKKRKGFITVGGKTFKVKQKRK
ncbi:MAG: S8 family serine peptidase [Blastocatellia bacterium]|nr:S8 family serine peptidase [Blastocatellia bacterium]